MTSRNLTLVADIGTSAMKGGLVTPSGDLVAVHRVVYRDKCHYDEQTWNPAVWIESLREIVASVGGWQSLSAVAISGHGPTLVPVDEQGNSLFYTLMWLDGRNLRTEGTTSFFLPKVAWFRQNHPELYARTRTFLSCPEYVNWYLTGRATTITPSKEFEPFIWSAEECLAYELEQEKLPPFIRMSETVGPVRPEAARFLGLPEGIPVVASGSDFLAALLGSGTVKEGRTCDRAGTSEGINFCSERPRGAPYLRTLPHVIPGLYNVSGILSSSGRLFEWMRHITGQSQRSYHEILQEIENIPLDRSKPLFIPSLDRENFEFARGGLLELHPTHSREDLGRSVVEAIGFGVRGVLDNLAACGCEVTELRVTGGQARNVLWNQLKADITGVEVQVPEIEDAELLGSAICALVNQGYYSDVTQAAEDLVRIRAVYSPRKERWERYSTLYHESQDYERRLELSRGNL